MTSIADETQPADYGQALLLLAIGEIATRLTDARPSELVAQDVLERAHATLEATECSLWLQGADGCVRAWGAGDETVSLDELERLLATEQPRAGGETVRAAAMRYGPRLVGYVVARLPEPFTNGQARFVDTLASMLATFIAHSERARRLEGDLQTRLRELEAQRRFTEGIVDALPLGLYVVDREYRIVAWNHKRETGMLGRSREEAIGRTIFEVLNRQPPEVLRREFDEVFRTGRIQQFQSESTTTGELRTFRLSKIPMRGPSNEVTHIITIGEDITDWVEARERVAQNEKLAAIGRLAAGVMHEINNPLTTISVCAETMAFDVAMAEPGTAGKTPEYLKIIESEVERCKRIIDGLLDFSRRKPLERQSTDMNSVIERALFLLNHHSRFKQLTVETELTTDLPCVHASAEQLIQVMIALLMNAADAMPQYGRVSIRTRAIEMPISDESAPDRMTVVTEIQDEGVGIPRAQMARIFEPFYTTKEQGRGTGLGLAICYGIVSEHGGRIEVESEEGQGSTFRIILPVEAECAP